MKHNKNEENNKKILTKNDKKIKKDGNNRMNKEKKENFYTNLLINSYFQQILFKVGGFFYDNLNKMIFIPILLFIVAVIIYIYNFFSIGTFLPQDFTLQGGLKVTLPFNTSLKEQFYSTFHPIYNKNLKIEELDNNLVITIIGKYNLNQIKDFLSKKKVTYNLEEVSPLLGKNFLKNLFFSLLLSFIFVTIVMKLIYYRWDLALSAVRALFFNIFITMAISTLFVPLSITTLPAYLMVLGYGIDTNIALINHMLKEKKLERKKRYQLAFNTGISMDITTLIVLIVGSFLANNLVFKNIFFVLMIGLVVDIIDTWILNGFLVENIIKNLNI